MFPGNTQITLAHLNLIYIFFHSLVEFNFNKGTQGIQGIQSLNILIFRDWILKYSLSKVQKCINSFFCSEKNKTPFESLY